MMTASKVSPPLAQRSSFREIFQELRHTIDLLIHELTSTELIAASVYQLPVIKKGTEVISAKPEYIPVESLFDKQAALTLACHSYSDFWISSNPDISTRHPIRRPGVLLFKRTESSNQLHHLVTQSNLLKNEFESLVKQIPESSRFNFLHDLIPGLMTLHVYRHIFITEQKLQAIGFFWANKQSIVRVTKDQMINRLRISQRNPGRQFLNVEDFDAWKEAVESEIQTVMSVSNHAELRIRRPIKVQPMMRLTFHKESEQNKAQIIQIPNPIPAIILCNENELPRLGNLKNYDKNTIVHKKEPTPAKVNCLVPRLHLYELLLS